ncbi:hypothetical protein GC194_09755 [bacterium]|nr:hypothetical protein [bacterium]
MVTKRYLILLIAALPLLSMAQEGKFIDVYGTALFSNIVNRYDANYGPYNGLGLDYKHPQTLSYGAAAYYSKMSESFVGWRVGFVFNNYAQDASSTVTLDVPDAIAYRSYKSRLNIQQFSIPLMLNFGINSGQPNDPVYFNMGFGVQLNYLSGAQFSINSNPPYQAVTNFKFTDYYRHFGASYLLDIELKIGLGNKEKGHLLAGVLFDKTIGGFEKKNIDADESTPKELTMPLGILKNYDYLPSEQRNNNTKNIGFCIRLGYSYKIFN